MERRFQHAGPALEATRARDGGAAVIRGLAAVYYRKGEPGTEFELWNKAVERIMPGAFDRAIAEDDVRALFNHDPSEILGRTSSGSLSLRSTKQGLEYRVNLLDTPRAAELVDHIARGDISGSSFAFDVLDEDWRKEDGRTVREVRGVRLYDVGPVTYPAYESTTAETKSAGDHRQARHSFRRWEARQYARSLEALGVAADQLAETFAELRESDMI